MRPPSTAYTRTFKVGGKCKNGFALSNKPYIIADAHTIFAIDSRIGTSLR